jgi:hypothetical protein
LILYCVQKYVVVVLIPLFVSMHLFLDLLLFVPMIIILM